jgi:hypothetical protein
MLSQDTSPHPDRPREQRPRSICHHQLVPEQQRRRRPDKNLPNPAAIAASPLHPEPGTSPPVTRITPRNAPGWRLTHRPRASTTATSTTIPITINAGHGKQRDHHGPQCPARPRNAASPDPGEAERQPRGACRGRDRHIRAHQTSLPWATGTTLGDGLSGTRHHAQCPGMWRDARSPSRTVLVLGHILTSAALLAGVPRPPAHRMPPS